jgi:lysozyme
MCLNTRENQLVDVDTLENKYPVHFVFIRPPWVMTDWTSNLIKLAWQKQQPYPGAYHYYRPNENSLEQARSFIKTVSLKKGFASGFRY